MMTENENPYERYIKALEELVDVQRQSLDLARERIEEKDKTLDQLRRALHSTASQLLAYAQTDSDRAAALFMIAANHYGANRYAEAIDAANRALGMETSLPDDIQEGLVNLIEDAQDGLLEQDDQS